MHASTLSAAIVSLCLCCAAGHAAEPFFMGLGDLPGGNTLSRAYGISADGTTVVGHSHTDQGYQPFRWTLAEGLVPIGLPGTTDVTAAWDADDDGSIVIGQGQNGAWRWSSSAGYESLLPLAGHAASVALECSNDGSVIVGCSSFGSSTSNRQPCRWIDSTEALVLEGEWHSAGVNGCSANGAVLVGFDTEDGPFRWSEAQGKEQLSPQRDGGTATATSADGSIVVGTVWGAGHQPMVGVIWEETGTETVLPDVLGAAQAFAYPCGISADGSTVVGSTGYVSGACLYDPQGGSRLLADVLTDEYRLDVAGWHLSYAYAVSADGTTIAGWGLRDGHTEAFVARLPEPATLTALLLLVVCRRR